MSDLQVEGMALKKLIKICKKMPLPFGFNPSTKIPDCYLAMHRTKPAKMLGKDAKDEGSSEKSAFGTIKVDGKLLILQCERLVPNLAKAFKKYLKSQKVMLNVEVRDASGNVMEADVEDGLPDDPELDGEDESEGSIDKAGLAKRLAELRKKISALEPKLAEKFTGPYGKIVAMFKTDLLEQCAKGADQIEAALPKTGKPNTGLAKLVELYKLLMKQAAEIADPAKRSNIEKALAQAATHLKAQKAPEATALLTKIRDAIKKMQAAIPNAPPPPDPKLAKLAEMLANYRRQTERVTDDSLRKPIEDAVKLAAQFLKSGDADKTTATLIKIRDALKSGIAASKKPVEPSVEAPETTPLTGQEAKDFEAWDKVHKELSGKVDAALTKGLVVDVDLLRRNWNWAVNNAADKKYVEAMTQIPGIRKMLETGTVDGKSAFNTDIPSNVKPFAESRVRWSFARSKMQSEMDKLKEMILSAVSDDPDLRDDVSKNIEKLTKNLENLDSRLEDKLDQIVNEKAGDRRLAFRQEAQKLVGEYRQELASDFFQDVDENSGFGNVAILATAQSALGAIGSVLQ